MDPFARYPSNRPRGSILNLYAWFFMRVSGLLLLVMAVFHLIYMVFFVPGGISGVDYNSIVARWTDPTWGVMWRTFDMLLLLFGLTHGANGLRQVLDNYIYSLSRRVVVKTLLFGGYLILLGLGATIIFSF